jgi:predicted glycosyltransferase involved in capsule biosynthesis
VQIDSTDRLRNLKLFLKYFETFFVNYEIIVVEQDSSTQIDVLLENIPGVVHYFIESDTCHSRGRNLDLGAQLSERRYLLLSDLDCFVHPSAIERAISMIDDGADFIWPFNGITVQIRSKAIRDDLDFNVLLQNLPYFPKLYEIRPPDYDQAEIEPMYGTMFWDTTGGLLCCARRQFFMAGAFNENFLSYGGEDEEFYHRVHKLGYKCNRVDGVNLFHFEHQRNLSSMKNNFYSAQMNELERVKGLDAKELRRYVNRGFKMLKAYPEQDMEFHNTENHFSISLRRHDRIARSEVSTLLLFEKISLESIEQAEKVLDLMEQKFDDYRVLVLGGADHQLTRILARKYTRHCPYKGTLQDVSNDELAALERSPRPILEVVRLDGSLDPAKIFANLNSGEYEISNHNVSGVGYGS